MPAGYLRCADCHTVIMGINQIDILVFPQKRINYRHCILIIPIAGTACEDYSPVIFKFLYKSIMSPFCRSRTFQPENLYRLGSFT